MSSLHLNRRGFTLIELLVVVAIIALLIGILIPSLGRARERARTVVCQSRLRSWGIGFSQYATEYDGAIPMDTASANTGIDGSTAHGMGIWSDRGLWFNGVGEMMTGKAYGDLDAAALPRAGANSVFVCPSSTDAAAGDATRDGISGGFFLTTGWVSDNAASPTYASQQRPMLLSYAMCNKIRNIDYDYHGTGTPASRRKSGDITRLATLTSINVLIAEKRTNPNELPAGDANFGVALTPNAIDPTRFTARHQQGGNVAFADAHVEWFSNAQVNAAAAPADGSLKFNQPGVMIWNANGAK